MLALTDQDLLTFIDKSHITHCDQIGLASYVQPASIDLPVGNVLYHIEHKFTAFNDTIQNSINNLATQRYETTDGVTLYKGQTYMIPCLNVNLPAGYFGKISPKSSLGRIDVLIRAMVDNTGIYDTIFPSTQGMVRLEVTPQSFNIRLHKGDALTQMMIFEETIDQVSKIDHNNEQFLFDNGKPAHIKHYQDKLILSVGVPEETNIGYKARYTDKIINLQKSHHYNPEEFFEPVLARSSKNNTSITLEKGRFYILPTKQQIRVPSEYSIELIPFTHLMGELRVHYAGFFDPGFGGQEGATAVLEVRPHEDTIVFDGQPICLMEIYKNKSIPKQLYGDAGNNYQGQQGATLAKFFAR